jgi:hypothetical protein
MGHEVMECGDGVHPKESCVPGVTGCESPFRSQLLGGRIEESEVEVEEEGVEERGVVER